MSNQGLSLISGIGAQVKKTVTNRKERLPHTSDNAPIRGADMKESRPWTGDTQIRQRGKASTGVDYVKPSAK